MNRSEMEAEVIRRKFPLYTPRLEALIAKVYNEHGGRGWHPQLDEHMLPAIWAEFRDDFRDLNIQASTGQHVELEAAVAGELTASGRKALLHYLDEAQSWTDLEDAEFVERYDAISADWELEAEAKKRASGTQRDRSAFFSRRRADADFAFWCKKKTWTAEEAVALSFEKDPRIVNVGSLRSYKSVVGSPFRDSFEQRLDDLLRAVAAAELCDPDKPTAFVKWATSEGIDFHPQLADSRASEKRVKSAGDSGSEIGPLRLHSYYQIVLGVFISKYGLNPAIGLDKQKVNYTEFLNDLKREHAGVDRKTLKNILREAFAWAQVKPEPLVLKARTRPMAPSAALPPPMTGNSQN